MSRALDFARLTEADARSAVVQLLGHLEVARAAQAEAERKVRGTSLMIEGLCLLHGIDPPEGFEPIPRRPPDPGRRSR